jgi:MOSC domain-containing protein YiiM
MQAGGSVVSIHIAPLGGAPMVAVPEIKALKGSGLQGDRYAAKLGTYSRDPGSGRHVTLVELEAIEALKRDYGIGLDPGLTRRNLVTRGVYLNHLVDQDFSVGSVVLRGTRLCEPCAHMEKLTVKGALRGLIHRGGLRAEITRGGIIRAGDVISSFK